MKLFNQLLEMHYGSLIDRNRYNDLDHADQCLYKFTADGFTHISANDAINLRHRYPYDGGIIYRGLHFDDQAEHDKFIELVKLGKLHTSNVTSWSPDRNTAVDFAKTKKSYFISRELMQAEKERNERGEHMTGYGGVVLKLILPANIAIDVNKSKFAKESEVLVPAGEYDVTVDELTVPFRRKFETYEQIQHVIDNLSSDPLADRHISFIMGTWFDRLKTPEIDKLTMFQLRKLTNDTSHVFCDIHREFDGYIARVDVYPLITTQVYAKLSDKMKNFIDKYHRKMVNELKETLDVLCDNEHINDISGARINGLHELQKFVDLTKVTRRLKQILVARYHKLNTREHNKTLTTDNIHKHTQIIKGLLQAIAAL
jgi:hypothetical protein